MKYSIILFLLITTLLFACSNQPTTKVVEKEEKLAIEKPISIDSINSDLSKIYSLALGDFIKAANEKNKQKFDTLYFNKRKNGQSDDFPDIELPNKIENTIIKIVTPEQSEKLARENNSRVIINLMGWNNKTRAEFIFVVFFNGFVHQYDYHIHYNYTPQNNQFELEDIEFKGPPFDY